MIDIPLRLPYLFPFHVQTCQNQDFPQLILPQRILHTHLESHLRKLVLQFSLLLLAASIELAGASFRPASYVIGKARALLNVQIAATVVYLLGFVGLVQYYGLPGIGLASLLAATVTFFGSGWLVQRACQARLSADRAEIIAVQGSKA